MYFGEEIPTPYWIKYILVIASVLVSLLLCIRYYSSCYNKAFKIRKCLRNTSADYLDDIRKLCQEGQYYYVTAIRVMLLPVLYPYLKLNKFGCCEKPAKSFKIGSEAELKTIHTSQTYWAIHNLIISICILFGA